MFLHKWLTGKINFKDKPRYRWIPEYDLWTHVNDIPQLSTPGAPIRYLRRG